MATRFEWTDNEVELLLRVTLEYKRSRLRENIDWESCPTKYSDIASAFQAQYPRGEDRDSPHDAKTISKSQITAKVKSIRNKYKKAVAAGRRRCHGRVIQLYFRLCGEIWGQSPVMSPLDTGIESGDLPEESCSRSSMGSPSPVEELPTSSSKSSESSETRATTVPKQRKETLQVC